MKHSCIICVILIFSLLMFSCGGEGVDSTLVDAVTDAAERTNAVKKYSASFLLEVTDEETGNIILFAQGSYDADKTGALIMSGSMVQTVNASPASLYMAYNDGRYYAKSGDVSTYTEITEDVFCSQFLCSGALVTRDVTSIRAESNGDGGIIYYFSASGSDVADRLIPLIDTEVFYYDGVRKMRADTLAVSDFSGEYVVDVSSGLLKSRTVEYKETVYDTAPYYPNTTVEEGSLKHTLCVRLKQTYKTLDGTTTVELPEFALKGE